MGSRTAVVLIVVAVLILILFMVAGAADPPSRLRPATPKPAPKALLLAPNSAPN
ncbi:MAG TPA: hypothetical protein VNB06_03450 [Thermoanaerobaculia bacterium]|nr:hypothetical protein [Thermoanaerobaculia bacterium]